MPPHSFRFINGVEPIGPKVEFTFRGKVLSGFQGESVASALLRAGETTMRVTRKARQPRNYYCGMGLCWECAVSVRGHGVVRACLFALSPMLDIELADGGGP